MKFINLFYRKVNTIKSLLSKHSDLLKNFLFMNKIKEQKRLLKKNYNPYSEKLIIFLTSGYDIINGGILSISSIYQETEKLKKIHRAESLLCTPPGDPILLKYTEFRNENYIYEFSELLSYFRSPKSIMIHIPEYVCGQFLDNLSEKDWKILEKTEDLRINVMIQNIEIALERLSDIKRLSQRFAKVTGTVAHEKYSNKTMRRKFGFPIHKLSTYVSPEQYNKKSYKEKEDILIVSPDEHPLKQKILKMLKKTFPQIKIQIIQEMGYEEYKEIISCAKWALTFGEGLDGYFVEHIFSGGISFSVYNSEFFTEDFKHLKTVYSSYEKLIIQMPYDMMNLSNEKDYNNYQKEQYNLCTSYYKYNEYLKNLELFYKEDYTFK